MSVTSSDDKHLAGEKHRRARDGNAYTLKEFKEFYGGCRCARSFLWAAWSCSNFVSLSVFYCNPALTRCTVAISFPCAMSATPIDDTHLAGEERRRARDRNAYTLKEFYGDWRGADYWTSADIHRAGDGSAGITVVQVGVGAECETAAAMETSWKVSRVCGVYETFEGLTDLCCLQERGAMCIYDDAGDVPRPSDDAHLAGEENRRAYTLKEFQSFYGDCRGADYFVYDEASSSSIRFHCHSFVLGLCIGALLGTTVFDAAYSFVLSARFAITVVLVSCISKMWHDQHVTKDEPDCEPPVEIDACETEIAVETRDIVPAGLDAQLCNLLENECFDRGQQAGRKFSDVFAYKPDYGRWLDNNLRADMATCFRRYSVYHRARLARPSSTH